MYNNEECSNTKLNNLWLSGMFNDVNLILEDGALGASKIILAGGSPYFRSVLTENKELDQIKITNVSRSIMIELISLICCNSCNLSQSTIKQFYLSGKFFGINNAVSYSVKFIKENMFSIEYCIDAYYLAKQIGDEELEEDIKFYILYNFSNIVTNNLDLLLKCPAEDIKEIINSDHVNAKNEEFIFKFLIKWLQFNAKERIQFFSMLLECVRFALMDVKYFTQKVLFNEHVINNRACTLIVIQVLKHLYYLSTIETRDEAIETPRFARPRISHDIMFAIGGWNDDYASSFIQVYDLKSDQWINVKELQLNDPRTHHGIAVIDHDIYIIGGFDGSETFYNSCYKLNVITKKGIWISCMQYKRCYHSVVELEGKIYVMGGFDGRERLKSVEMYDPKTNQWTEIGFLNIKRSDSSAAVLNGKIYITGGFNGYSALSSVEVYITEFDQWFFVATMDIPRYGHSCIAFQDYIYIIGGYDRVHRQRTVERYSCKSDKWESMTQMILARSNFGSVLFDGKIYVMGGYNNGCGLSSVEYYDMHSNTWCPAKDMAICRAGLQACIVKCVKDVTTYSYQGRDQLLEVKRQSLHQIFSFGHRLTLMLHLENEINRKIFDSEIQRLNVLKSSLTLPILYTNLIDYWFNDANGDDNKLESHMYCPICKTARNILH